MKTINPYPNFTIEQICELSLLINTYIVDNGHTMLFTFLNDDCYSILDENPIRLLKGIFAKILFLEQEISYYRESHDNYTQMDLETYAHDIEQKITEVIDEKYSTNKRVWPKDILQSLGISNRDNFNDLSGDSEYYNHLLYTYINGFNIANGKQAMSYSNIDKYIDKTPDFNSIFVAIAYLQRKYQQYLADHGKDINKGILKK